LYTKSGEDQFQPGPPFVVLVIVFFCVLLGTVVSLFLTSEFSNRTLGVGAGVGLVLGIAATIYYYRR
jgi:hypothetical protein